MATTAAVLATVPLTAAAAAAPSGSPRPHLPARLPAAPPPPAACATFQSRRAASRLATVRVAAVEAAARPLQHAEPPTLEAAAVAVVASRRPRLVASVLPIASSVSGSSGWPSEGGWPEPALSGCSPSPSPSLAEWAPVVWVQAAPEVRRRRAHAPRLLLPVPQRCRCRGGGGLGRPALPSFRATRVGRLAVPSCKFRSRGDTPPKGSAIAGVS